MFLIFSISLFFGGTSKKSEAYEYFMKGEYELLQNDFKMAEKYYKKATDILKLSNFLKHYSFDKIFIFYPSLRIFLAAKIANIKKIYCYLLLINNYANINLVFQILLPSSQVKHLKNRLILNK